ncbi:MAG: hypothetical protein Q9214_003713 [Letrouitia sp. 1 TL-2023]
MSESPVSKISTPSSTLLSSMPQDMARFPKPRYFVSRPDGTITPLIALDELPSSIRLTGVPTTMSTAETTGMISLGVEERSSGRYMIDMTERYSTVNAEKQTQEPFTHVSSQQQVTLSNVPHEGISEEIKEFENETPAGYKEKQTQELSSMDNVQVTIDDVVLANKSTAEEAPTPSGKNSLTKGKKVYCTHWVRRGECDFTQQGCLYKHEMPDIETLQAIGIRGIPTWYLKAHPERARKYFLENAAAAPTGNQQRFQAGEKQSTSHPPLWRSSSLSSRPTFQSSPVSLNRPYIGFPSAQSGHLHSPQQYWDSNNTSNIFAHADDQSPLDREVISSHWRKLSSLSYGTFPSNPAFVTTEATPPGTAAKIANPTVEPCAPPHPDTSQLNPHKAAIDAAYSPINPSPRADQGTAASPIPMTRKSSSVSSDTLALAPKGPAPTYRRRFAPPGEELFITIPEEVQSVREKAVLEKEPAWNSVGTDRRGGHGRGRGRGFQNSRGTRRRRGAAEDMLLDL